MRVSLLLFTSVLALGLLSGFEAIADESDSADIEMKQKLEFSKQILDGLVTEDYEKILKNAQLLNRLGERKWIENESSEYRTQNQVFWFTTGNLVLAAKEKNIDGVTLSYTQMTHSCVNCHRLLRSASRAD